ncbi:MAG: AmmeMemoRadiSam system radical SAM enzyme [Chloroflexi bacterium]|nr:AmmeMemoRadiSam system radical SAM enzyme [Chloroflexota bacterium]MBU1751196.1 AmmeMemoRadiSam system radical SAM enzyme [Chloroflexota bacterium]
MVHKALLYEPLDENRVRCNLCAHRCTIAPGKRDHGRGICHVRENRDGTLYTLVYGRTISQAVDPIEKKPLFHFYPGTGAFSIATPGCNLRCSFCQNSDISQMPRDRDLIAGTSATPAAIVAAAQRYECRSIAYTYTEPTIFFEYAWDIAKLARPANLANVFVTNGFMTPEMLRLFCGDSQPPLMDAANVDLKAFTDEFYRQQCGARLQPVLDSLKLMKELGVWVEVTTLVIPGLNDSDAELRQIAAFIADELGVATPWHVSRFHPTYRLTDRGPTPLATLIRARDIGLSAGLRYVYIGNVPGSDGEDTFCYSCGQRVIGRWGFRITDYRIQDGRCAQCGTVIDGVGL